jgi:anti-sigma B factor antagonist
MSPDGWHSTVSPLIVPEIVTLPTEIDLANAESLGNELRAAVGSGAAVVIADMTRTVFCDSSGIRHLLIAHDAAVDKHAELRIVIPSAAVLRVLHVTGADHVLSIYRSLQAALTN